MEHRQGAFASLADKAIRHIQDHPGCTTSDVAAALGVGPVGPGVAVIGGMLAGLELAGRLCSNRADRRGPAGAAATWRLAALPVS